MTKPAFIVFLLSTMLISASLFLLACPTPAPAQQYPQNPISPMQAGLAIVASTALTVPGNSSYAVVCARGANVNYTTDGTTVPTALVGMQLLQNQCVAIQGQATLSNFRAIQQSATATLDASYFK